MPQISGLGHVGLYCPDLGKMRDFYARVLGLAVAVTDEALAAQVYDYVWERSASGGFSAAA